MKAVMKRYLNKAGNSGVDSYQVNANSITVKFKTGQTYTYSYRSTGADHVEQMKVLAEKGRGLATYINKYVRDNYD